MQDGSVPRVVVRCRDSPAGRPVSAVATRRVPAQPLASRGTVGAQLRIAGPLVHAEGSLWCMRCLQLG